MSQAARITILWANPPWRCPCRRRPPGATAAHLAAGRQPGRRAGRADIVPGMNNLTVSYHPLDFDPDHAF